MKTEEEYILADSVQEPKSKRTPVRLRHKIEKASAAKQRKQRKVAKSVCLILDRDSWLLADWGRTPNGDRV